MSVSEYMSKQKEIYEAFIKFIENIDDHENENIYNDLILKLSENKILEKREKLNLFLHTVVQISKHHFRNNNFREKINQILNYFLDAIKKTFSNFEILDIFKTDKLILLYLIQNKIFIVDDSFIFYIKDKQDYHNFFYPEIKELVPVEQKGYIERQLLKQNKDIFTDFEANRQKGENESPICTLIRNNSVEEFIEYYNKSNFTPLDQIRPSAFETHPYLIKNTPTLIEYSAFFGSIEIVVFLHDNLQQEPDHFATNLWFYSIYSQNSEMIEFVENLDKESDDNSYNKYLNEAIKCHHNDIASYIQNNHQIDKVNGIPSAAHYYNQHFISLRFDDSDSFYYLCRSGYTTLVKFYTNLNKAKYEQAIQPIFK